MCAVMTLPKIFKEKLICESFHNIFPNKNCILKNIQKNFRGQIWILVVLFIYLFI